MAGDPRNYPDWPKMAAYQARREALWRRIREHKERTGSLPWQATCNKCEEREAVICIASDISKPGTPRLALCGECCSPASPEDK